MHQKSFCPSFVCQKSEKLIVRQHQCESMRVFSPSFEWYRSRKESLGIDACHGRVCVRVLDTARHDSQWDHYCTMHCTMPKMCTLHHGYGNISALTILARKTFQDLCTFAPIWWIRNKIRAEMQKLSRIHFFGSRVRLL